MFAWLSKLDGAFPMRYFVWFACGVGLVGSVWLELALLPRQEWLWLLPLIFGALVLTGWYDIRQESHAILRNYPVIGHLRFMLEFIRPEIRQYFIEADDERMPDPHFAHERELVRGRGEEARRAVRAEDFRRVRVERERGGGPAVRPRGIERRTQDRPVPVVHPVKNPGRNRQRPRHRREAIHRLKNLHQSKNVSSCA